MESGENPEQFALLYLVTTLHFIQSQLAGVKEERRLEARSQNTCPVHLTR
jgi:hypothetical protein